MISCFYIRTLTIVSILFLNICCGSNQESNKKIIPVHDPIIKDSSLYDDVRLKELKDTTIPKKINIDLKKAKNIEILSINKEMGKDSTDGEYYEKCKSWSLTIGQLKTVIREFKSMSSVAQDLSYSYMPCRMKGEIKINNIEFKYWVNAGSTLTLINKDTTLYFGCSSKECKKFFLTGKDLPEKF